MRPMSAELTNVDERRRRFLFVDFLVRKWLLPARILLIFSLAGAAQTFGRAPVGFHLRHIVVLLRPGGPLTTST